MSDLIYGRHPVLEALKQERAINKLLVADAEGGLKTIIQLARSRGIPVQRVDRKVLDNLTHHARHQGVLAYAAAKEYVAVEDLLNLAAREQQPPLLVACDHLEDPHNLGAILRVVDAAGAHGVIIPKARSVALSAAVAKTSAGAVEFVAVARVPNLSESLRFLQKQGLWVVGLDGAAETEIYAVDWRLPTVLVVGGEGKGLSRLVKENCDLLAKIPMAGRINSLNAAVAVSVALYEAVRQRRSGA
ncbi:MAG TPA: 23S rRNA (guanosine(2251)-2'-O)-methyltransferase RlmB [Clostridia bacterium]|nr:23S rRNA (guanosine(2251)-2'-O)-methyltransferase RlmB [Clostridia bacterium]